MVLNPIHSEPQVVTRHAIREAATAQMKILVAEDNLINQNIIWRLIEKERHSVVLVNNGLNALEALEADHFDLIFMDVQMPEMDGLQATAEIRRREMKTGKHHMIAAMTAHALKGDRERCLAAGMDEYLTKPVQIQELNDLLERVANGRSTLKVTT